MVNGLYTIYLKKTVKDTFYPGKYFIIVRKGFTFGTNSVTCVGYWCNDFEKNAVDEDVMEVIIPNENVAYIHNVSYRYKGDASQVAKQ